jgi:hypothetical protein
MWILLRGALLPALGCCALIVACGAPPRDRHVEPQRPTFAANTRTTPEDVLEVELGAALEPARPHADAAAPLVLKLGLGPRTELFGGIQLWRALDGEDGLGDALVGVRHRLWNETYTLPATAFQLTAKLPTASSSRGLGSGELDFFAAGIHTRTIDRTAFTLFYQLGLLGEVEDTGQDFELALAGLVDLPIHPRLAGFGELAGVFQPERDHESIFLTVGGTFRYAPWMYLDLGLALGLSSDAPDLLLLVGLTRSAGRILAGAGP